jgi:hypothetical protein
MHSPTRARAERETQRERERERDTDTLARDRDGMSLTRAVAYYKWVPISPCTQVIELATNMSPTGAVEYYEWIPRERLSSFVSEVCVRVCARARLQVC